MKMSSIVGIIMGIIIFLILIPFISEDRRIIRPKMETYGIDTDTPLPTDINLQGNTYMSVLIIDDMCTISFPRFGFNPFTGDITTDYVPLEALPISYMTGTDLDIYGTQDGVWMKLMTLEIETGRFIWRATDTVYTDTISIQTVTFSISELGE